MAPRILLVDDEPNLTSALKHTLYKEKYKIFTACSAQEALGILSRETIDVIVSDERMPGMSGSELITLVRRKYPDTVRIILTGQASSEAAIRAINEGDAYRFLIKPCNGLDLVITIRRALQYQELCYKTRQLIHCLNQQTELLQHVESIRPGITKSENIPPPKTPESTGINYQDLMDSINSALRKSGVPVSSPKSTPAVSEKPETTDTAAHPEPAREPSPATDVTPPTAVKQATPTPAPSEPPTTEEKSTPSDNQPAETETTEEIKSINDVKPIMTRTEIKEILDSCEELKGLSPTVAQILKMTQSSQCSMEKVVKVVKQDHAISLKVLKIANSVVYTRGEPVDTIRKAVMRIGLSQIRQVVLNISVVEQFNNEEQEQYVSSPQFWEHSIATGMIAAMITHDMGGKDPQIDAAFTMGLLHDVGRLVYLELLGEKYHRIFKTAEALQMPLEQVESRMLLVNHADAMDRILHSWKFSKDLINPIALHQLSIGNIRRMAPRTLNEVATLALANRLAHALLLGTSGNLALYPTEEFASTLRLKPELFHKIVDEIPGQTDDVKFSMLASSNQQNWPKLRDQLSERMPQPFRPISVSAEPDFDSMVIFCNRLRDTDDEENPPNVGVIFIKAPRERVMVTTKLKEAEAEAGVEPLPVILLSPKGNIELEELAMAQRRSVLLPYPVALSRFINAFNTLVSHAAEEVTV